MNANEIVAAWRAVNELGGVLLPYKAARKLAGLKKRLSGEVETVLEMERALAREHGGHKQPNGSYQFDTPEAAAAFSEAHKAALEEDDPEITFQAVDLSRYTGQISISASALEALEGIVIFEHGEGEDDGDHG